MYYFEFINHENTIFCTVVKTNKDEFYHYYYFNVNGFFFSSKIRLSRFSCNTGESNPVGFSKTSINPRSINNKTIFTVPVFLAVSGLFRGPRTP